MRDTGRGMPRADCGIGGRPGGRGIRVARAVVGCEGEPQSAASERKSMEIAKSVSVSPLARRPRGGREGGLSPYCAKPRHSCRGLSDLTTRRCPAPVSRPGVPAYTAPVSRVRILATATPGRRQMIHKRIFPLSRVGISPQSLAGRGPSLVRLPSRGLPLALRSSRGLLAHGHPSLLRPELVDRFWPELPPWPASTPGSCLLQPEAP